MHFLNETHDELVVHVRQESLDGMYAAYEVQSQPGTRVHVTVENYTLSHNKPPRYTCERGRLYVHTTLVEGKMSHKILFFFEQLGKIYQL